MKPLENLRVVDATSGPVGGLATMMLADFGAEVIKVESRDGDAARNEPHARVWLRGKRSVVCDDAALYELIVGTADAVLTDRTLDVERLRRNRPDLVCGVITRFEGLPLDEALIAARLGRMISFRGVVNRDGPVYSAVQVATHAIAQAACSGIVSGLYARAIDGNGCRFETDLARGLLPYEMGGLFVPQLQQRGLELPPLGGRSVHRDADDQLSPGAVRRWTMAAARQPAAASARTFPALRRARRRTHRTRQSADAVARRRA